MSDSERQTTYAAEDMVQAWLDEVDPARGEVSVTVSRDGQRRAVSFMPEPELRFGRPTEVTGFVDRVMDRLRSQTKEFGSNYRGREQRDVRVVAGRGWARATYADDVICLPERERGGAWALRAMVVLHELAHHLNSGIDGAIIDSHGEGFRATFVQLLDDIGWTEIAAMLREAYAQVGLDRSRPADDSMLTKIGKLLRHAEGAATEAERDTFFAKAQELATTHSVELAVARAAHDKASSALQPTFEAVKLGHRGQQSNARFVMLMLVIAGANDVRCTIRSDNTTVTLYGFEGDIEVTKALYVSLVLQMVADADAYIRSGAHKPVHGRTARASFYAGWTQRIGERFQQARRTAEVRVGVVDEVSGSKALALVSKEIEVDDYFGYMKRQHGVRGQWRGTGAVGDGRSVVRGQAAAERARLGRSKQLTVD